MQRTTLPAGAVALALALGVAAGAAAGGTGDTRPEAVQQARLVGRSVLPAETYRPGSDASGFFTGITTPIAAPFPGQPVQGFSAVHRNGDGTYLVMSDNGFGSKANSQDFELRVHRIRPDTTTGVTTALDGGFGLSDPDHRVPWTIWRDGGCTAAATLPAGYTCPAPDRVLTGWDFDIESMEIAPDGTFWFGEEFGPFLLHTDDHGRLLSAPVPTPGVKSPSSPTLAPGETPNLANSKGFEGMAMSPDGRTLYPMLEGPVAEDTAAGLGADLRIFRADLDRKGRARFTGDVFRYRLEFPSDSIGDLVAVNDHQMLAIERDQSSGPAARLKAVYLIDLRDRDHDGYVDKDLLVNLLAVPDPGKVGGFGDFFTFPFVTIESVAIEDRNTLSLLNDNNFPGAGGRAPDRADEDEFIVVRLDRPLDVAKGVLG
ncbi:MAG TPA: esterase-like activity of phytase family protein [Acidimicrobiales bacterium]|nr:esterase-like activity of phytase family protein [Acidimicrobiales bacterium]